MPCSHKTFEQRFCNRKSSQSENCIQYLQCSDWSILEFEYENRTQKIYDGTG